jgi:hypothetical protein
VIEGACLGSFRLLSVPILVDGAHQGAVKGAVKGAVQALVKNQAARAKGTFPVL